MGRVLHRLTFVLPLIALVIGCGGPGGVSVTPPRPSATNAPSSARVDLELAGLLAQARSKGPLLMPSPGEHLPLKWGTRVPEHLYGALEKLGQRPIPGAAADDARPVVYLVFPAAPASNGARTKHSYGVCMLTVVGYQYADHWEYSYSYLSGDCGWDGGGLPPDAGGAGGAPPTPEPVGTPSTSIPNCPLPSGAAGTTAETAINNSARLKDLAVFLANNRNSPSIIMNTKDLPVNGTTGDDGIATYGDTPAHGSITIYTRGLTASGHPIEQVLYHELLHFYFAYAQYDLGGANAKPLLPTSGTATATINGVTYTFDLADHSKNGGYMSYEHLLIHNALVEAFGADKTGALREALTTTHQPLTDAQRTQIIKDFAAKNISGSITGAIPKGEQCGVTKYPSGRARVVRSNRWTRDFSDMNGITFDATYVVGDPPATPVPVPPGCTTVDALGYCGYYTWVSNGSCSTDGVTYTSFPQSWNYRAWNANTGTSTDFAGMGSIYDSYCTLTVRWGSDDPQTTYDDPNLPGPFDSPRL